MIDISCKSSCLAKHGSSVVIVSMPIFFLFVINQGSMKQNQFSDKECSVPCLRCSLGLLDANFFKDDQVISILMTWELMLGGD